MSKPSRVQCNIPRTLIFTALIAATGCTYVGRVNVPTGPIQGQPLATAPSTSPDISADGNVIAYVSEQSDLVPGDNNGVADVFVRSGNTTTRVNVTPAGTDSAMPASDPAVSGDGRYVVFVSEAADLVVGDTNGVADIFIRDLATNTTQRVNLTAAGGQSTGAASQPVVSGDGRYVAFVSEAADLVPSDTNGVADVFVRDLVNGTTTRVSLSSAGAQADGASTAPSISYSGQWVAYASTATNLVSDDTNAVADVFVSQRTGGSTRRASAALLQQANGASGNPQVIDPITGYTGSGDPIVVYESLATNLVTGDNNGASDVFVSTWAFGLVMSTNKISSGGLASHSPDIGVTDGGPGIVVTYVSNTSGSGGDIHAVVRKSPIDATGSIDKVVTPGVNATPANGPSTQPAVSNNGRFVAFRSRAGNLNEDLATLTVDNIFVTRALQTAVTAVEPARVGLLETRDITVRGRGFDPESTVAFDEGITVNSTTFVSSKELTVNITATAMTPNKDFYTLAVSAPGVAGGLAGMQWGECLDCIEIAAVVEQPGSVNIEITGGNIQFGTFAFDLPGCVAGQCTALPGTVTSDGELAFGISSLEFDPIPIPVELIQGVEVTLELVPKFVAPEGNVIPANGVMNLGVGFAIGIKNALLPTSCALGPVVADLSTTHAGGVPYEQNSGTATMTGGFTSQLAVTNCGFFTSVLNTLFNLPIELGDSAVIMSVRLNPVLTGSVVP